MNANNTFQIPTAAETAKEVIAQMAASGYIVPSGALDIDGAAVYLKLSTKTVRGLVEYNKIKCANATLGSGQNATLRFSIRELDKFLTGE